MKVFDLYGKEAADLLRTGSIGVFPTETVFGIGASALNKSAVETIFDLKKRPAHKPFAVLVVDVSDLTLFGISGADITRASEYWPGPNTVILPSDDPKWQYLHRDSGGLSFRVPNDAVFRDFLRSSGPLATTSANLAGEPTITSAEQAYEVFGDAIGVYMQPNPLASGQPSTVLDLSGPNPITLR